MPQDIKDLFDITNENIIDYEDVYNSYLEKLTFLIDEDFNFEKLFNSCIVIPVFIAHSLLNKIFLLISILK